MLRKAQKPIPVSAVVYTGASASGRVLLSAWLLFSLVTVAIYTGKLTSNSVVTKQRVPVRSLSELVKRTDYRWGMTKGTLFENIFAVSSCSHLTLSKK